MNQSLTPVLRTPAWAADFLSPEHLMPFPAKLVPAGFKNQIGIAVTLSAAAAVDATSLSVTALSDAIPEGSILDFGVWKAVTVTLSDASVSAGDTTITVSALSNPIPAGSYLDFSGGTNAQVVRLSAAAAKGDTSLTIYPADGTIANSSTATFAARRKLAMVSARAAKAATSISVNALGVAIASGDTAYFSATGKLYVKSGTVVGRTYAERDAGTGFGPAEIGDDEIYILAFNVPDVYNDGSAVMVRPGTAIRYNRLPEYSVLDDVIAAGAAPTATGATTGGTLAAGTFYGAYTFVNAAGQESQFSVSASTTVASGTTGSVAISGIPALPTGAVSVNIYLGAGNTRTALYRVASGVVTDRYVVTEDWNTNAPNPVGSDYYATTILDIIKQKYECIKGA